MYSCMGDGGEAVGFLCFGWGLLQKGGQGQTVVTRINKGQFEGIVCLRLSH